MPNVRAVDHCSHCILLSMVTKAPQPTITWACAPALSMNVRT